MILAESDAAVIDAVAAEAGEEFDLPALTRAEVNLGKFAVTKVNIISLVRYRMTLTYVTSYKTSLNKYSTVPPSMQILRAPALRVKSNPS